MEITPYFWAILAALGMSAWTIMTRKLLKDEKDYIAIGTLNELFSLVCVALIFVFFGSLFPSQMQFDLQAVPPLGWLAFAISIVCYAIAVFLSYKGFRTAEASERAVVSQIQNIWILALAGIFLGEMISDVRIMGVGLIISGSIICMWRKEKMRWHVQGVQLVALSAIFFGTATLSDKVLLNYFPIPLYAFFPFLGPALVGLAMLGKNALARMKEAWSRHGKWILILAAVNVIPFIAFLIALFSLPASVVGPVLNTNVVLTALGGMILLNEKEGWKQKIIGAALAFAGALMLGM